ncbi:hypothetical protein EVAR_83850_1 [Eumeta japonica]|uniref:Uncharacterized protein n=1 Tax=Eumeta variegata TaxID=151549 RepID=A0A4C1UR67_EUMVA|nr:hypothetical protein EVAR_83850_1 [Eumeta japonica]
MRPVKCENKLKDESGKILFSIFYTINAHKIQGNVVGAGRRKIEPTRTENETRNRIENETTIRIENGTGTDIDNAAGVVNEHEVWATVKSVIGIGIDSKTGIEIDVDRHKDEEIHSSSMLRNSGYQLDGQASHKKRQYNSEKRSTPAPDVTTGGAGGGARECGACGKTGARWSSTGTTSSHSSTTTGNSSPGSTDIGMLYPVGEVPVTYMPAAPPTWKWNNSYIESQRRSSTYPLQFRKLTNRCFPHRPGLAKQSKFKKRKSSTVIAYEKGRRKKNTENTSSYKAHLHKRFQS